MGGFVAVVGYSSNDENGKLLTSERPFRVLIISSSGATRSQRGSDFETKKE